jgi:hypothetical protein
MQQAKAKERFKEKKKPGGVLELTVRSTVLYVSLENDKSSLQKILV